MNVMIVDDTKAAIDCLAAKLERYPGVTLSATAMTGEDGIDKVLRYKPELLFLDMELPDMNGIGFLERVKEVSDYWCYVVIYTAYDDYMLPAFRNKVFDFLLKPIDDGGKLLIYTNAVDFRLVQIRDICVFRYDHDARVWTVVAAGCDRPLRLKRSVNKDAILAIDDSFVQVSQKCIINVNYLLEVRDNVCSFYPPFDGITDVKVARFFRRKLVSRYNSL